MRKYCFIIFALLWLGIGRGKGQYTNLLEFNGVNGELPIGTLTLSGGVLYGMTSEGGSIGSGRIFSIDTNGANYREIYDLGLNFSAAGPDGSLTLSGGVLYGMAPNGGAYGYGCVFSVDTDGNGYTNLYSFNDTNGSSPSGSLTLSGNTLYGIAAGEIWTGFGNIFALNTNGLSYKVLHRFNNPNSHGSGPGGSLILSGARLFGKTPFGGGNDSGCIFSLDTNGTGFKILFSFTKTIGTLPGGSLTLYGNQLFGMAELGGAFNYGCIFSIDTNGNGYTDLFDFNGTNGANPTADLTLMRNIFVGMTPNGGIHGGGNIFSINKDGTGYYDLLDFNGTNNPQGSVPYGDLTISGSTMYGMTWRGGQSFHGGDGVIFSLKEAGLGINELAPSSGVITIYPNPSNGKLTLQLDNSQLPLSNEKSQLEVYNVLGEEVFNATLKQSRKLSGQGDNNIDLSSNPNGVYLYRVVSENGTLLGQGKLIIQK